VPVSTRSPALLSNTQATSAPFRSNHRNKRNSNYHSSPPTASERDSKMSNAYDSPKWRNENRSGGSNDNRPNHMSNGKGNGGPVNSNGMPPGRRAPDGYGTTASASDQQARNRSQSTPNMTTGHSMSSGPSTSFGPPMPAVTAPAGPALRALLSSGASIPPSPLPTRH
jgi:hypothetical protein